MYIAQILLSQLPNIELVSLLIIITTYTFGVKAVCSVYIFVFCEIATYGLGMWSIAYLYVWTFLYAAVLLLRKCGNRIIFTLVSGIFGLCFGALTAVPYFIAGGMAGGLVYIINGFWFDILHCAGNIVLAYLLYDPLRSILQKALEKYKL